MIILGIETSCDETAVAVLKIDKKQDSFTIQVLSNVVSSQVAIHRKYGGVVPIIANREHTKNLPVVFKQAIQRAFPNSKSISSKIDLIAVTQGPGLLPSLLIGISFARTLSWAWQKPIIGVNHLRGHLVSFLLPERKRKIKFTEFSKIFPAICLLVSGGHTLLVLASKINKVKILGETRDDAAGECFDKGARLLGLSYPGGPAIAREAKKFSERELSFHFPRPMIDTADYDFSFSGLKTALLYKLRQLPEEKKKELRPALAYEYQEAITDVLVHKTLSACQEYQVRSIIVGGGVSANQRLRDKFVKQMKKKNLSVRLMFPLLHYTGDNAAMIAGAGYFAYINNSREKHTWKTLDAQANLSLR